MRLDSKNIDREIRQYLEELNRIEIPTPQEDILVFIDSLKRKPLGYGPYPKVSLFEASNRIMSDLIVLFGVRQLLNQGTVGHNRLPFREYVVHLGVEGGSDLEAAAEGQRLIGEAFNVAPSLFQKKNRDMKKKLLQSVNRADYRLIIFNADAVRSSDHYIEKSEKDMLYLPVDVWVERCNFMEGQHKC